MRTHPCKKVECLNFYLVQVEIRTTSPLLGFRNESTRLNVSIIGLNGRGNYHARTKCKQIERVILQEAATQVFGKFSIKPKQLRRFARLNFDHLLQSQSARGPMLGSTVTCHCRYVSMQCHRLYGRFELGFHLSGQV